MRRPEWAAAGTFPAAWRTVSRYPADNPVLSNLSRTHVITCDRDQVSALPVPTESEAVRWMWAGRLPFEMTYLSLDNAPLTLGEWCGELAGVQCGRRPEDGTLSVQVYTKTPTGTGPIAHFWADSDAPILRGGVADMWGDEQLAAMVSEGELTKDNLEGADVMARLGVRVAVAVLYLLESANVELVEGKPTRQERRQVERKGGRIALTVAIRAPKKRPRFDTPVEHPGWSHRWEVRGHYKHFPVGTRLADSRPEKLVDHATLGQCRRIWCPPHVKGPQDKPLVPKLRVVEYAE